MEYDDAKMQDAMLALFGVFEFENSRVWKRYEFAAMEALHEQGWITDPRGRNESVYLTEERMSKAKALAARCFARAPKS